MGGVIIGSEGRCSSCCVSEVRLNLRGCILSVERWISSGSLLALRLLSMRSRALLISLITYMNL